MSAEESIVVNLTQVWERIAGAARRAGRTPEEVTLIAVTKTHPVSVVEAAYRAGIQHFGENRVEEAEVKIPGFRERFPGAVPPRWHMIGHLQRRKARPAVALFDIIHSVDSVRLAERVDRMAAPDAKTVPVLLQVNVSGEPSKEGFQVHAGAGGAGGDAFMADVEQILALPWLLVQGLMTMAPIVTDAEQARPVFAALRELRDVLRLRFAEVGWRELSMGMSDDFDVAVEEGATMVRIGRAIFGERKPLS